ncbi:MAG: hypothetical protein LBN18_07930 [Dysgonamonadaceae bacterium]|jgi:hypothetical protein|nr:hypothetical protein [Dysgonamonadaceae bacterium]
MNKVVLVVIYNHKYEKNIELIEKLYKNRFSWIYHLMPFYSGDRPNVIPVYENSVYFQGYVAQGFQKFYQPEATHYFFVADDMILNPEINETNYREFFHLNESQSFISDFFNLYEYLDWPHIHEAFIFKPTYHHLEIKGELPDYQEVEKKLIQNGALNRPIKEEPGLKWKQLYPKVIKNIFCKKNRVWLAHWLSDSIRRKRYTLSYPLAASYSDIFIVSAQTVRPFCHYCGVFAALRLFVEIALPTALALSAKGVVTEKELSLKGKPLWTTEDYTLLEPYKKNLELLWKNYPKDVLYIHPIKLSQWDTHGIS